IFYDKILYTVYSDALQQNTTDADYKRELQALKDKGILPANTDLNKITFDGNIGASANNVKYLNGPSYTELQANRAHVFSGERRILNPNGYQNPYTHQFSIGYQKQLDKTHLFYVDIVHNISRNLFRLRDLNAPSAYPLNDPNNVIVRTQAQADATRPVAIDQGGFAIIGADTVRGVARNVIVSETAGKAEYTALSLNFQKDRGDGNFAYRFIYTLSRLKNNTEDVNFKAMDSNNFANEWAPGINDRTHVLNGFVTYYPLKRLSFTVAALLQSGQPINRIPNGEVYGTSDLNGDGRSFGDAYVGNSDRQPGETRNNDRLPWANTFDLAGEYDFKTGEKSNLILRADVFNLFNAANLSGYSNNATQSNQVQVGSTASGLLVRRNASAPRQIQFSLRWVF
ncbi:MAG: TonB-dependent receptor, partial [Bacteroidota bacterium]